MTATAWSDATATAAAPGADHPSVGGYEVLALLRAGDSGPLYRVRDAALGRDLMLEEFLPPALVTRDAAGQLQPAVPAAAPLLDRARRRFVDESRALAGHEQPHLARVLHVVEAAGTVCRVLPGYAGRPLSDLLAEGAAPRDESQIRSLLTDLMGALEVWHNLAGPYGGIHASRVLWSQDGHALLLGPDAASRTTLGAAEQEDAPERPPAPHLAAADVQAAVALARTCMRTHPGGAGVYSSALRETLDAAGTLGTPARFLERLTRAAPPAPAGTPPPVAPSASAPRVAAPASAPVSAFALPTAPASTPSPTTATAAAEAAAADTQVDPATAALIRSIVDAIPDREPAPPSARNQRRPIPGDVHFVDLDIAAPEPLSRPAPRPKSPTRTGLFVGLALLVLVALGFAAQTYLRPGSNEGVPTPGARAPAIVPDPVDPAASVANAPSAALSLATPASAAAAPASTPAAPPTPAPPAAAASVITLAPTADTSPPMSVVTPATARAETPRSPPTPTAAERSNTRRTAAAAAAATPRQQCGSRVGFSLYRCMEQQCGLQRWRRHAQCVQMRQTDSVPE